MSSRKTATRRGTTKKRAQRATSNVFAMFNQDQIQEFKEAFNMIDHNRFDAMDMVFFASKMNGVLLSLRIEQSTVRYLYP